MCAYLKRVRSLATFLAAKLDKTADYGSIRLEQCWWLKHTVNEQIRTDQSMQALRLCLGETHVYVWQFVCRLQAIVGFWNSSSFDLGGGSYSV
ncbi:hypothetical protein D3C75_1259260 [compost metagenome]